jgi:hypothetical protein
MRHVKAEIVVVVEGTFSIGPPTFTSSNNAALDVTLPWRNVGWQCMKGSMIHPRSPGSSSVNETES